MIALGGKMLTETGQQARGDGVRAIYFRNTSDIFA